MTTHAPVALTAVATFGTGAQASLRSVEPIQAKTDLPGETSGPALRVVVAIRNDTSRSLRLGTVVANLTDSAGHPATTVSRNGSKAMPAVVQAGRSVTGTYVFTVAERYRKPVTISVGYSAHPSVVLFTGTAR